MSAAYVPVDANEFTGAWLPVGIPLAPSERCSRESRRWQKTRVAIPPRSSLFLPGASKFIRGPSKKNGPVYRHSRADCRGLHHSAELGAAEIAMYAQFLPEDETAHDLISRMEDLWRIAQKA